MTELVEDWGAKRALPLYCSVDPDVHRRVSPTMDRWDLGYLGTFSNDRQGTVQELVLEAADSWADGRFVVAGPLYPETIAWPSNVDRFEHVPPAEHAQFYCEQRFTLNVTRSNMIDRGWSPSVRLFEAASCGTPIISDRWAGLDALFEPDKEIIVATDSRDVLQALQMMPESKRLDIAASSRARVLKNHTADHRAAQLEEYAFEVLSDLPSRFRR